MKNTQTTSYRWAYLPIVFSSAAILATQVTAAPGATQQYQDAKQVHNANYEYVGGQTQAGFGVTDEGDVSIDLNHVFSETDNSSTGVGLWAGYDLKGDDKGIKGRGVQLNHNWVSRDKNGRATHVNKVFGAYDRNEDGHDKATIGYGQENQSRFWDVHASKGLSGKKNARVVNGQIVRDKAYDYGVGGNIGTFIKDSNIRVRAGLDHEWGDDVGAGEKTARNTTLSAGVEKFFKGTPHSIALDVAASKRSGGYNDGSDDTDVTSKLSYRYDFGGASIYQPDRRYRRVRVEVPGAAVPPRYAKKTQYKRVPTYKTVPTYAKKTVRVPYKQLVKSTMELEGQTFFKLNSSKLIPSAKTRLKQIAREIRKNGYKGSIRITGNTCGLGDPVYDQRLSEQRAKAVRNFLIKNGFNPDHLIARGLGKSHPKYPRTPDQDFKNRRVDIEYVSEQKSVKTGYRTEQKTVQTGTRRVVSGFKNVPAGVKNVMVDSGKTGAPRVIWKTEVIPTSPAWIKRALHNNITHNTSVNTYQTTAGSTPSPVNGAPVAVDDTQTIRCNTDPITINVLNNDSDPDGDKLTITNVTNPKYGTVRIDGDQVIYVPNGDGCGQADNFTYTVSDSNGNSDTATVTINVNAPENSAPIAVDDSATTTIGQSVALTTLSNDSDPDNDTLTIIDVEDPAHGSVVVSGGQIIYTPDPGFVGTDTFNYTISDGNGHTATATETVIVKGTTPPQNVAPVAENDVTSVVCGTSPITLDVLANDSDADGDTLTITKVTNGQYGTTRIIKNKVVYTPNGSGCGKTDSFTYTISDGNGHTTTAAVQVNMSDTQNTAPDAVDDTRTTSLDQPVTINVLGNDTDPENDPLTITAFTQGTQGGTVTKTGDGKLLYQPKAGFVGTDTFTYTISDGHGGTDTATVTVIVKGNDPLPKAYDDDVIMETCTPKLINVLDNDNQGSGNATVAVTKAPLHGSYEIKADGSILYWANDYYVGNDSFEYTITDSNGNSSTATVSITVKATNTCGTGNTAPIAIDDNATTWQGEPVALDTLANDSDPDNDPLTIINVQAPANGIAEVMDGQIVYQPNPNFVGTETFTYTISDGNGNTATATETVMVKGSGCNTTCTKAEPDDISTTKGKAVIINVLANDAGKGLKLGTIDDPANGTVMKVGNRIKYTPDPGFTGTDSFWYGVTDATGYKDSALVVVYVEDPACNIGCK